MEDSVKKETKKKDSKKSSSPNFFEGVKMEFKKISWPDKKTTFKQSIAVVIISVLVGLIIAVLDYGAKTGINKLIALEVPKKAAVEATTSPVSTDAVSTDSNVEAEDGGDAATTDAENSEEE